MENTFEGAVDKEAFNQSEDLAPIEHALFGSGIKIGELTSNTQTIGEMLAKGESLEVFQTPLAWNLEQKKDHLNSRRKEQKYFPLSSPFNIDDYTDLASNGVTPVFELDNVGSDGKVITQWRLALKRGNVLETNPEIIKSLLKLSDDYTSIYSYAEQDFMNEDGSVEKRLTLKINAPKP